MTDRFRSSLVDWRCYLDKLCASDRGNSHATHHRRGTKSKTPPEGGVLLGLGVPNRIRTGVTAVKGQCPRPLDDGDSHVLFTTYCNY
jgi:hypothetical protein